MSTFVRIGNTILANSRKKNNGNMIKSKSFFSETVRQNNLQKSASMSSFNNYNSIYNASTKYNDSYNINNESQSSRLKFKHNFTKFNFCNISTYNNYKKFSDLRNKIEFHSFNKNDYIKEANKILRQRFDNKNHDLLGLRNKSKSSIFSDKKEISLNNYLINEIKKEINSMITKQDAYKKALINRENEFETDYRIFLNYLENRKNRLKKENDNILKLKEIHEESKERFYKELMLNKKLNEELEKRIKIICLLKNYGSFVYRLFGMDFWMKDIPDLSQKNKNFEDIYKIIIEKYDNSLKKNNINEKNENFDDTFIFIKFKEYEEKFINAMKSKNTLLEELDIQKEYDKELNEIQKNINNLKKKEMNLILEKTKLIKSINNIKNRKQRDENIDKYLEYIMQLGKETEKLNINEDNYFVDDTPKEYQKMVKEYDFNYYTVKTLNNLKKNERLINKFIEYIEKVEKSEDHKIITEIELNRKNENKREKLKSLKLKQQEIYENRNIKSLERNGKFVIIGRYVPKLYPFSKSKNKKLNKNDKNKNDIDLLYFHDEDDR
jgi:hypothetical protein